MNIANWSASNWRLTRITGPRHTRITRLPAVAGVAPVVGALGGTAACDTRDVDSIRTGASATVQRTPHGDSSEESPDMSNHPLETEWTPPIGARYLAPSGRTWTVRSITPRGRRAVITYDAPDGEHGAVVDFTAISKMIALDPAPTGRPATHTTRRPVQVVPKTASVEMLSATTDARRPVGDTHVRDSPSLGLGQDGRLQCDG